MKRPLTQEQKPETETEERKGKWNQSRMKSLTMEKDFENEKKLYNVVHAKQSKQGKHLQTIICKSNKF
jgi:hypothetical protein